MTFNSTLDTWYLAQTLQERLEELRRFQNATKYYDANLAHKRLAEWKKIPAFSEDIYFKKMLEANQCSEEELLQILGVPPERLYSKNYIPDWLISFLECEKFDSADNSLKAFGDVERSLLCPCIPLLNNYSNKFQAFLAKNKSLFEENGNSSTALYETLMPSLLDRLFYVSRRAIILELNFQRVDGSLEGDTSEARYEFFLRKMREQPHRMAFFNKFPVLARDIQRAADAWLCVAQEFSKRLSNDRKCLQKKFGILTTDPLDKIHSDAGDLHNKGRSVFKIVFKSGKRIIYKPHSLAIEDHYQKLISWINDAGLTPSLRHLQVLNRVEYGWVEYIDHFICKNDEEVDDFYKREGALLALMNTLSATDMHFENIVAAGPDPVLVDLETLFHGNIFLYEPQTATDVCAYKIAESVMNVGLLPMPESSSEGDAYDISGLGATGDQKTSYEVPTLEDFGKDDLHIVHSRYKVENLQNRPRVEKEIPVSCLIEGFSAAYRLLARNKEYLLKDGSPILAFQADPSRIIVRATWIYCMLLSDLTHPDLLTDELDRTYYVQNLWNECVHRHEFEKFIFSETNQICDGDVPYFSITPEANNSTGSDGTIIDDAVYESGLDEVKKRLRNLSENELQRQVWFIRASLGYMDGYSRKPENKKSSHINEELLLVAEDIGDEVIRTLVYEKGMASCLNVSCVEGEHSTENVKFAIHPADNGLYDGLSGICMFLAYLGKETGGTEYKKAAEAILNNILQLEKLYPIKSLSAFSGTASQIYLLSHLGNIWNRPDLLDNAEALLTGFEHLIEIDQNFDIINGSSGCLLALLSLSKHRPEGKALKIARFCGDHLLKETKDGKSSWSSSKILRGFSHGTSGISFALCRLYQDSFDQKYLEGAINAAKFENSILTGGRWTDQYVESGVTQCAWCHGAPGIAIARMGLYAEYPDANVLDDIISSMKESSQNYWRPSQNLCHGTLGNLETFIFGVETKIAFEGTAKILENAKNMILEEMYASGWKSALASETLSNGLMTGLSGIGYGLMRLRSPKTVPSVLTLSGAL